MPRKPASTAWTTRSVVASFFHAVPYRKGRREPTARGAAAAAAAVVVVAEPPPRSRGDSDFEAMEPMVENETAAPQRQRHRGRCLSFSIRLAEVTRRADQAQTVGQFITVSIRFLDFIANLDDALIAALCDAEK